MFKINIEIHPNYDINKTKSHPQFFKQSHPKFDLRSQNKQ